jgi:gas vesicle protein
MRVWIGIAALVGAVAGVAAMFFSDPRSGRRRRSVWREGTTSRYRSASSAAAARSRDVAQRTRGAVSDLRASARGGEVGDEKLTRRVRSRLGHLVTHAHSLEVEVQDGHVTLRGRVAEGATAAVLEEIAVVPGVKDVTSELAEEALAEGTPALRPHRRRAWFLASCEPEDEQADTA